MNIFALDNDPKLAASYHTDRHVAKQILECVQILATAHHVLDGAATARTRIPPILRPSHANHPASVWVQSTVSNYRWTARLLDQLCIEYAQRFNRTHDFVSNQYVYMVAEKTPFNIEIKELTPFVQTFQVAYRRSNPVEGWRAYYIAEKQHLAVWSPPAARPSWFKVEAQS